MEKIDWEIEDVTNKIQSYKYPRKEPVVRRSESQDKWGNKIKIYVIKTISTPSGKIEFNPDLSDLKIYLLNYLRELTNLFN